MSNLKKPKNYFKNLVKRILEIGVNLKSLNVPYAALNPRGSTKKMERKGSSSRWGNGRVPHGCFAIYVGDERQRFVLPMGFLSHPLFSMLLEKAEEDYGFNQRKGLAVPCDVETFENVLFVIHGSKSGSGQFDLESLLSELLLAANSVDA